jgi:hypothetical protein
VPGLHAAHAHAAASPFYAGPAPLPDAAFSAPGTPAAARAGGGWARAQAADGGRASRGAVLASGWLAKRPRAPLSLAPVRRRWCVLVREGGTGAALEYFAGKGDAAPRGRVAVHQGVRLHVGKSGAGAAGVGAHLLQIGRGARALRLCHHDTAEIFRWLVALAPFAAPPARPPPPLMPDAELSSAPVSLPPPRLRPPSPSPPPPPEPARAPPPARAVVVARSLPEARLIQQAPEEPPAKAPGGRASPAPCDASPARPRRIPGNMSPSQVSPRPAAPRSTWSRARGGAI